MSLDDLRSDLAQVAPAKTEEDLNLFASELRLLLSSSESERQKGGSVLDKKALWERVAAEIARHEEESAGIETSHDQSIALVLPPPSLTDTPKSRD